MALLAAPLVDWRTIGKIALVSLIGGAGVVILFGMLLLANKKANSADSAGRRFAARAAARGCGLVCVGVVVIGIYAMADKPSSRPAKAKSAAFAAPAKSVKYRSPP